MGILRHIFRRDESKASAAASDLFDVYHAKTLQAAGLSLVRPTLAEAEQLGTSVREFFLHNPETQWRYPLGLLPIGQKRFVKWLFGKGRAQHSFSDEQIVGFLHATAADLPRHVALTYLINPEWQRRFPAPTKNGKELLAWLRAEFPKFRRLRAVKALSFPSRKEVALAGVNFLSHFCYPSGLQQAAVGYCASLEAVGLQVPRRDVPAGVQTALEAREPFLGLEEFSVTISNVSPAPHYARLYQRAGLAPREGVRRIAYWAWELETVPNEWMELAESIDEIWTPTPFVSEALRTVMPVPIYDMLPGVSIGEIKPVSRVDLGIAADDFVFLFMFDMLSDFARKNPLAVVRAFRRAFSGEEKATLLIKLSRGKADAPNLDRLREEAGGAKIFIVDELVPRAEAYGYIALADAIVSLHRSEGFGMLMAEAMLLGKPVIATNYSGNTAYMNSENSLLVDYEMTTIAESGAIYKKGNRWAEPSVAQAAEAMRRLYENRAEAEALGSRAETDAARLFSLESAGARMKARLDEITYSQV